MSCANVVEDFGDQFLLTKSLTNCQTFLIVFESRNVIALRRADEADVAESLSRLLFSSQLFSECEALLIVLQGKTIIFLPTVDQPNVIEQICNSASVSLRFS